MVKLQCNCAAPPQLPACQSIVSNSIWVQSVDHMMGVAGVLGAAMLRAIHGATHLLLNIAIMLIGLSVVFCQR